MKKLHNISILNFQSMSKIVLLFITLFCCHNISIASHAAGGELIYKWVGGTSYQFTFKFYSDFSLALKYTIK